MSKLLKNTFLVFGLIFVGKSLSFLRDIIISSEFGSNYFTDAYFAANNVPSVLFAALITGILAVFTPRYQQIKHVNGRSAADLFASRVINVMTIISLTLTLLGVLFAKPLVLIVSSGFDLKTEKEAINMVRWLVFSFPLSSATLLLANLSNIHGKYYSIHLIPISSAIISMLGIYLCSDQYGIYSLVYFSVLAFLIQLLLQIWLSAREFKFSLSFGFFNEDMIYLYKLMLPLLLGYSIDQINLMVNSNLASRLAEGSLSNLNYAQRLQATIMGTISTAVISVTYPLLSSLYSEKRFDELLSVFWKSIIGIILILCPILIFSFFNSISLVSFVYHRGNFSTQAVISTALLFQYYVIAVLFISLREFLLRMYFILNDTRMPFLISIVSLVINVFLSIVFMRYFDLTGLAMANLIATVISFVLLMSRLNHKRDVDFFKSLSIHRFFILLLGVIVLAVIAFVENYLNSEWNSIGMLIGRLSLLYGIFYIILAILKLEDIRYINTIIMIQLKKIKK